MICPKCKSKNFVATKESPTATRVYGYKEKFDTADFRYRQCVISGCGYKFRTQEVFFKEVEENQVKMGF